MHTVETIQQLLEIDGNIPQNKKQKIVNILNGNPIPEDRGKLLNTREAARLLGVHPKTLLKYGKAGKLSPVRHSQRRLRWKESDIKNFLEFGIN